jgi:hypothetical protein
MASSVALSIALSIPVAAATRSPARAPAPSRRADSGGRRPLGGWAGDDIAPDGRARGGRNRADAAATMLP